MDHNNNIYIKYSKLLEEYIYWTSQEKTQWLVTCQLFNGNQDIEFKLKLITNTLCLIRKSEKRLYSYFLEEPKHLLFGS